MTNIAYANTFHNKNKLFTALVHDNPVNLVKIQSLMHVAHCVRPIVLVELLTFPQSDQLFVICHQHKVIIEWLLIGSC